MLSASVCKQHILKDVEKVFVDLLYIKNLTFSMLIRQSIFWVNYVRQLQCRVKCIFLLRLSKKVPSERFLSIFKDKQSTVLRILTLVNLK